MRQINSVIKQQRLMRNSDKNMEKKLSISICNLN